MKVIEDLVDGLDELTELRRLNSDDEIGLWVYSSLNNSVADFFSVCEILWPSTIVYEGRLFLKSQFDPHCYRDWVKKLGSEEEAQKMINHVHLVQDVVRGEIKDEHIEAFFLVVKRFWERTLADFGINIEYYCESWEDSHITFFNGL